MNELFRLNWPTRNLNKSKLSDILKTKRAFHLLVVILLLSIIFILYYTWQDWFPWFWGYFVFEFGYKIIGLPLSIPFLYSVVISRWRVPLIVWGISILVLLPVLIKYHPYSYGAVLLNVALLMVPAAILATVAIEFESRAKRRDAAAEKERDRQIYMTQILNAQENERRRIAQELHDDTTQTLMVIASNARSLLSSKTSQITPVVRENLEWTRDTALRLAEDMRRLSLDLRPSVLDTMGLLPALNWLVNSHTTDHNTDVQLAISGEIRKLEPEDDVIIFRIVQEALNNVRQHSRATKVCVRAEYAPGLLKLSIQDNGVGFILPESMASYSYKGKLGLIGMQQRTRSLGGTLNIDAHSGKGTLVSTELPI